MDFGGTEIENFGGIDIRFTNYCDRIYHVTDTAV